MWKMEPSEPFFCPVSTVFGQGHPHSRNIKFKRPRKIVGSLCLSDKKYETMHVFEYRHHVQFHRKNLLVCLASKPKHLEEIVFIHFCFFDLHS